MKYLQKATVLLMTSALALAGCAENMQLNKETTGTLLGAGAGAWAGSSFGKGSGKVVATALGTVAGGLLGNQIGRALDEADRTRAERATYQALESSPSGRPVTWRNPDNRNRYGEVTPERTYTSPEGYNCREYTQKIYIDGEQQVGRGTACRDYNGAWKIQNS